MVIIVKVTVGQPQSLEHGYIVKVTVGQPQSLEHGYYSKSNGRPASVVRTWLL